MIIAVGLESSFIELKMRHMMCLVYFCTQVQNEKELKIQKVRSDRGG